MTRARVLVLLLVLAACQSSPEARLTYQSGGSGSPTPAHANDLVHLGFGPFEAVEGPVRLWAISALEPEGFQTMGQGFLEIQDQNNLCQYSYGSNGHHPCPSIVSLSERPVLAPGHKAWLVLTVQATEEGRHPIGPVEVHYTSGDFTRSLVIHPKDYLRTAVPFHPKNEKMLNGCFATSVDCT